MTSMKVNSSPCKTFSIKLVSQGPTNQININKSKNPVIDAGKQKAIINKVPIKKRNYSPNHKFDAFVNSNRIKEILNQKTLTLNDKKILEFHNNSNVVTKLSSMTSSNSNRNFKFSSISFRESEPSINWGPTEREKSLPSQKSKNERKIVNSKCEEYLPTKALNEKLENKDLDKKIGFSKIHEMLTRRISQVKVVDTKPEVVEALCEAYMSTLYEIGQQMSPKLSCIINSIVCGMKNALESLVIKVKKCNCEELTKKIDVMNNSMSEANKNYSNEITGLKSKLILIESENKTLQEKIKEFKELKELKEIKERNLPTSTNETKTGSNPLRLSSPIFKNEKAYFKKKEEKWKEKKEEYKAKIKRLSNELEINKNRQNKLVYFLNLLQEKGIDVRNIYNDEVKSISTERFTEKSLSENEEEFELALSKEIDEMKLKSENDEADTIKLKSQKHHKKGLLKNNFPIISKNHLKEDN